MENLVFQVSEDGEFTETTIPVTTTSETLDPTPSPFERLGHSLPDQPELVMGGAILLFAATAFAATRGGSSGK